MVMTMPEFDTFEHARWIKSTDVQIDLYDQNDNTHTVTITGDGWSCTCGLIGYVRG
jgi:hypothetical protein